MKGGEFIDQLKKLILEFEQTNEITLNSISITNHYVATRNGQKPRLVNKTITIETE